MFAIFRAANVKLAVGGYKVISFSKILAKASRAGARSYNEAKASRAGARSYNEGVARFFLTSAFRCLTIQKIAHGISHQPAVGASSSSRYLHQLQLAIFTRDISQMQKNMPHIPPRGHRQLRKGRQSIPGFYYYLTVSTLNRRPLLGNTEAADIIFKSFDWLETNERLRWFCVIVMPDHIHAVIQLRSKQTLSRLMQSFKSFTAKEINAQLGRSGSLWQVAYYEHGIRHDESLKAIVRYCYENPVRWGLAERARDYPYWRCKFEME